MKQREETPCKTTLYMFFSDKEKEKGLFQFIIILNHHITYPNSQFILI